MHIKVNKIFLYVFKYVVLRNIDEKDTGIKTYVLVVSISKLNLFKNNTLY